MAPLCSIDLSPPLLPSLSFFPKSSISFPPLHRPTHLSPLLKTHHLSRNPTLLHSTTKNNSSSLSSIVDQLQEDKKEEETNRKNDDNPVNKLAERWHEIHGQNNWAGLFDPMDSLLRIELIRYGEFVQACYDAFDYDVYSRYCGTSKYKPADFFESLGMASYGYEVTRYLYATYNFKVSNFFKRSKLDEKAWSQQANWMGYVAVSNDAATARLGRRDIVVAWRGTVTKLEWIADFDFNLRSVKEEGIPCPDPSVKVESGFVNLYTDKDPNDKYCMYSAREQVLAEVKRLVEKYGEEQGEEVSVTVIGHSLGSALATLSAYDLAETGVVETTKGKKAWVTVFSYSGPRVGNDRFKQRFEKGLGLKALRIFNVHDFVPKVPGIVINEKVPGFIQKVGGKISPWSYHHVGVELALDHKRSPYLKETDDISCFHNLEAHLHLLDGYQGKGPRFVQETGRDPALVNKSTDFLKPVFQVPPNWRQDLNRGMIQSPDGRWMQPEREKLEAHPEHTHHYLTRLGLVKNKP